MSSNLMRWILAAHAGKQNLGAGKQKSLVEVLGDDETVQ